MYEPLTNLDTILRIVADATTRCAAYEGKLHLRPRPDGSLEPDLSTALYRSLEYVMRGDRYRVPANVEVTPEYRWSGDEDKFFDNVMDYAAEIRAARRHIRADGRLRIRPDIIVHERGLRGPNYFVLELKLNTNRSRAQADFDRLKLRLLTDENRQYRYHLGMELRAYRALVEGDRQIKVVSQWQHGQQIHPQAIPAPQPTR